MNNRQDAKDAKKEADCFTRSHEALEGGYPWRFWRLGGSLFRGSMEMI